MNTYTSVMPPQIPPAIQSQTANAPQSMNMVPPPGVVIAAPHPGVGIAAPLPVMGIAAPSPVVGIAAPLPVVGIAALSPVSGFAAPAHASGFAAPAPASGFAAPSPASGFAAPSPASGFSAPSHASGFSVSSPEVGTAAPLSGLYVLAEVAKRSHSVLTGVVNNPSSDITPQAVQFGPIFSGTATLPGAYKLVELSLEKAEAINLAKKFAKEQSIKSVLVKQTIAHQQQQMLHFQTTVQRQQALALMCRVYVGSLNVDVDEPMLRSGFTPFGSIKTINLSWDPLTNKHKGFAFIEFDLPEAAQLALEYMNGSMLGGRNIKVVRPHCSPQAGKENPGMNRGSNVMPQAQPIIDKLADEAREFNRVYISCIHMDLTENDIQSVFEAFGKIRKCELSPDPLRLGKHRGFGFIEYEKSQGADDSVISMNRFDLGGQLLRVGKAITPPMTISVAPISAMSSLPTAAAVAMAAVTARITAMDVASQSAIMIGSVKKAAAAAAAAAASTPSPVLPSMIPPPKMLSIPPLLATIPVLASPVPAPPGLVIPSLASSVVHMPPPQVAPVTQATLPSLVTLSSQTNGHSRIAGDFLKHIPQGIILTESQKKLVAETIPVQTIAAQENINISGTTQRNMLMQKLMLRNTSEMRIVVLRNMVSIEDVDDTLQGEVESECAKFGNVLKVVIYQEKQSEAEDAEVVVKIFVEFQLNTEAECAVNTLHGRYFGGNKVQAQIYDPVLYKTNDFSA